MGNFKLNLAGIRAIKKSAEVTDAVRSASDKIAGTARANAPVDSGEYRSSIHVEMDTHPISGSVGHIVASSDHALIVESRTGNLGRSL